MAMKTVSATGRNLTLLVHADYTMTDDWMTFAFWYTCQHHWPDVRFLLSVPKIRSGQLLFRWLHHCKVKRIRRADNQLPHDLADQVINDGLASLPVLSLPCRSLLFREPSRRELDALNEGNSLTACANQVKLFGKEPAVAAEWLATPLEEVTDAPLLFVLSERIGAFDVNRWAALQKTAPFGTTWQTSNRWEEAVMRAWSQMANYYSFCAR